MLPDNPPSPRHWQDRARFIQTLIEQAGGIDRLTHGPQSLALLAELQQVFCTGAWLAAVILAQTVLDAAIAESESFDGLALNEIRLGRSYVWLRNRRNDLLHRDGPSAAITPEERVNEADRLEREARKAVTLVIKGLAGQP